VARALWSGAISFGLVNVPVKLYNATPSSSAHGITLHRLHGACGNRISHVRRCNQCQVDVPWEDVVSGYEYQRGRFAVIQKEEVPEPERGEVGAIAIEDFVEGEEIDPLLYDRAYWIVPDGTPRAYALLHQALVDSGRVAVARVVVRTRSHLAVVRPVGSHLVMHTLFFAGEGRRRDRDPAGRRGSRDRGARAGAGARAGGEDDRQLRARALRGRDHRKLRKLIEEKIAAKEVTVTSGPVEVAEGDVVDIMDALRRSVERTARERAESAMGNPPAGGSTPAGKAPAARGQSAETRGTLTIQKER
jgi:DNA end-binding protein Ku